MIPALPSTQTPTPARRDREAARSAGHRWMGRPLSAWPDGELVEIVGALETHVYGERQTPSGAGRAVLMARIHDLDTLVDSMRPRVAGRRVAS